MPPTQKIYLFKGRVAAQVPATAQTMRYGRHGSNEALIFIDADNWVVAAWAVWQRGPECGGYEFDPADFKPGLSAPHRVQFAA
jgi:hypothetical protein